MIGIIGHSCLAPLTTQLAVCHARRAGFPVPVAAALATRPACSHDSSSVVGTTVLRCDLSGRQQVEALEIPLAQVVALLLLCAAAADARQVHVGAARSFAAKVHAA